MTYTPPPDLNGSASLYVMIGRVLATQEHLVISVGKIQDQVTEIAKQGSRNEAQVAKNKSDIHAIKSAKTEPFWVPGWEVAIKRALPWAIIFVALAATGKLEVMVAMVQAVAALAQAGRP
jgi:hypothetical protein